ncbi:hypothetical protein AJ80_09227 [Polytolypa hystricis UAMH7299]|uniref:Complex 1 LYR protein domain-containing protein n=1 Tax=Polytolypa hystricis (strain UAMH7299) TaxID=1447883 RepID=A0A2B7WU95_POLH7|nr:hypothetical protein AJ80_09227 [Polytolypa hystricis UAMH7299]
MSVATLHRETAFQARSLFRSLLRQSRNFAAYNFREYARRRTIDGFREHQNESEERKIQELIQKGLKDLRMMKRQTIISQFYQLDRLVVEGQQSGKETGTEGGIVRQKETGYVLCGFFHGINLRIHAVQSATHSFTQTLLGLKNSYLRILLQARHHPKLWFRSSRSSRSQTLAENAPNRSRTGHVDHDVFEGLPVRRWSRQSQVISQTPKYDVPDGDGSGSQNNPPELPMPRDSHLLTPMSRALLRAARSGCKYIRPATKEVEDEEKEVREGEDVASAPPSERTFTAGKWSMVPRHLEPPEAEFLAKRRPGLPSLYGATTSAAGEQAANNPPPMRKTKFKKVDPATGNVSIYEAWVPEGHEVEGEIKSDTAVAAESATGAVVAAAPAPGTVIEGVGVVDKEGVVVAEPEALMVAAITKKRLPPPKRKAKGVGKGRPKKVMFAPGDGVTSTTTPISNLDGTSVVAGDTTMGGQTPDSSRMSIDGASGEREEEEDEDENDVDGSDDGEESGNEPAKTPDATVSSAQTENIDAQGPAPAPATSTTTMEPKMEPNQLPALPTSTLIEDVVEAVPKEEPRRSPDVPLAAASSSVDTTQTDTNNAPVDDLPPPEIPGESQSTLASAPPPEAQISSTSASIPEDSITATSAAATIDPTPVDTDFIMSEAPTAETPAPVPSAPVTDTLTPEVAPPASQDLPFPTPLYPQPSPSPFN